MFAKLPGGSSLLYPSQHYLNIQIDKDWIEFSEVKLFEANE